MASQGRQCVGHPQNRGGSLRKRAPWGQNMTKMEFFAKKIDFCLMPARKQNLQGGGMMNQYLLGPNGYKE